MSKSTLQLYIITAILLLAMPISTQDANMVESSVNEEPQPQLDGIGLQGIGPDSFVSRWNTTLFSSGSSNTTQVKLPVYEGGDYNFVVDWGDGKNDTIIDFDQEEVTHTYYNAPGVYIVIINGTLNGWRFSYTGDRLKIIEISQWGDLNFGIAGSYFQGCSNLVLTATDSPDLTGTTSLAYAFQSCGNLGTQGSINSWDVSSITDMNSMFYDSTSFNQPIDSWNVSNVSNMKSMFFQATSFNQPIGNWNVSSTNIASMFSGASTFNQPIGDWDVSSVTDMSHMFQGATSFNWPIGNWNVSSVINMDFMFQDAISFNQPIGNWDVSGVSQMEDMFMGVTLYHQYYDDMLTRWSLLTLQSGVIFHAGNSQYSSAAARSSIVSSYSWAFTDGGIYSPTPADLSNPDDVYFKKGITGNLLFWDVADDNPGKYNVTSNGSVIVDLKSWNTGYISLIVDGFSIGTHNITIYVFDAHGTLATDSVIVTVIENILPDLSSPDNIYYELNTTGNEIVWVVGDKNPSYYNVSMDGSLYQEGSWTNGTIVVVVDDLLEGIYVFILNLFDTNGNKASNIVVVDVDATVTATETETTTDTVNGTVTDTIFDTITEYITTIPTDITNTTDTPIFFTFVVLGLVIFVVRKRQSK